MNQLTQLEHVLDAIAYCEAVSDGNTVNLNNILQTTAPEDLLHGVVYLANGLAASMAVTTGESWRTVLDYYRHGILALQDDIR
jgi:hypothetical protein